jgi:hypothetical protein
MDPKKKKKKKKKEKKGRRNDEVFYPPECDAVHFENLIRWDLLGRNINDVLKKGEEKAEEIVLHA